MRPRSTALALGIAASLVLLAEASGVAAPAPAPASASPVKATGAVELDDPAGDVGPVMTGTADHMVAEPGFDMVHLSIGSDGKKLKISVTLTEPPGARAGRAVDFYFDTDNDRATGATITGHQIEGFEYAMELDSCVDYEDHLGASCSVTRKAKPTANFASVHLDRFKGNSSFEKEAVIDNGFIRKPKESVKTPVAGKVLTGVVDYEDMKLRSGQTIRIVAAEWTKLRKGSTSIPAECPEILLKLR